MKPMNTAPRDGTMIRLLVEFAEHSLEDDNSKPIWTIGANGYDNDGQDVWQFAGWNWSHDCFTDGVGIPMGWMPMEMPEDRDIEVEIPKRQYFYRNNGCQAISADDPDCICWRDEGTGPLKDYTPKDWRIKP